MRNPYPPPLLKLGVAPQEDDVDPVRTATIGLRKKATGVRPWLLLDSIGQAQVVEAGKHAIMRRTGLPTRDLRILDPLLSYPSTVLGRERAIVINLEHIKAIITAQEVLLLNSRDPSVTPFVEQLQRRILRHHQATKSQCLKHIYGFHILEPSCGLVVSGTPRFRLSDGRFPKENPINPLQLPKLQQQPRCFWETSPYYTMWANDEAVQRALHIREGTVTEWKVCNANHYWVGKNDTATYSYDVSSSVACHRNLTNKSCRALIFSGDHDMIFPYLGTQRWIQTLNLTVESTWAPWFIEHEVGGYGTTYSHNDYSLTFATVKGAGHVAPLYKPKESLAMVDRWLDHYPL